MSNEQISQSYLFDVQVNKYISPSFSQCGKICIMLFTYLFYFFKWLSHLLGIIEVFSLGINSYINNYGICTECYIAIARSKGGCSVSSPLEIESLLYNQKTSNITQKHRSRVPKTFPSNKNSLEQEINHVKWHITKSHLFD